MSQFDADALPPLRDVIKENDLGAKKSLGQNFLLDLNLTRKIVRGAGKLENTNVIEVGPGPGGLTRAILESSASKLYALEKDRRCITALQPVVEAAEGRLELQEIDALTVDPIALCDAPRAIIANLPYNIATVLLINWLKQASAYASMTLMFQKEVAGRITAAPKTKAYGRLSVLSQWLCQCHIVFDVPASAFTPPPKVTSAIVHLRPRKDLTVSEAEFKCMEQITAAAFGQRRKMLRKSLQTLKMDLSVEELLTQADIPETARAEEVDIAGFIRMMQILTK